MPATPISRILRFRGFFRGNFFHRAGREVEADLAVLRFKGEVGVEFTLGAVGDEAFKDEECAPSKSRCS